MALLPKILFVTSIIIPQLINSLLIVPSITNSSGEYYVTSQSGSFADSTIQCNSLSLCYILCDLNGNCTNTIINASLSSTLRLECNKYQSCYDTQITTGPITTADINCIQESSCSRAIFNLQYTVNVDIICDSDRSSGNSGVGACYKMDLNAEFSTNFNASCSSYFDCYYADFNVNSSSMVLFDAGGYYALGYSDVIAIGVTTSFIINCIGISYSCYYMNVSCPENVPCDLNCVNSYGCGRANIHIVSQITPYLDLSCNTTISCSLIEFYCSDTLSVSHYVYHNPSSSYVCSGSCCPSNYMANSTNIIECGLNTDCFVDCSNIACSFQTIINGSIANSLVINCPSSFSCELVHIMCPNNGLCDLKCIGSRSCRYVKLFQQTISSLQLNCSGSESCQYMFVDLIILNLANVTCSAYFSCQNTDFNIMLLSSSHFISVIDVSYGSQSSEWNINGLQDTTNISIEVLQNYALSYAELYINNINKLDLICKSDHSCTGLQVWATHITSMNVICEAENSCQNSEWNIHADDISFLCHEYRSCYASDFTVNITNSVSMTAKNSSSFYLSELDAFCSECMNTYNCLENITLFCGLSETAYPIFTGDQCRNCICDGAPNTAVHIDYDYFQWQQCTPTPHPTPNPTPHPTNPTTHPTADPTTHPTTDPTTNPTTHPTTDPTTDPTTHPTSHPTTQTDDSNNNMFIIIGGSVMGVLILTAIVLIFVCRQKINNKQQANNNKKIDELATCIDSGVDGNKSLQDPLAAVSIPQINNELIDTVNAKTDKQIPKYSKVDNGNDNIIENNYNIKQSVDDVVNDDNKIDDDVVGGILITDVVIGEIEMNKIILNNDNDSEGERKLYKMNAETSKNVYGWLKSIECDQYYDLFINNGFDSMKMIKQMKNQTNVKDILNDIGIKVLAHQLIFSNEINQL